MKALDMHYTVQEVALLLRVSAKTVIRKLRARELGEDIVNLGTEQRPDYRIPAAGVNAYLDRNKIFTEPGIAARSIGELRRKAAV